MNGREELPEEDTEALVDSSAGKAVRWVPGEGWVEGVSLGRGTVVVVEFDPAVANEQRGVRPPVG
jgi:hypothetical protein